MGDFYAVFCTDLNNGNEYNVIIKQGFVLHLNLRRGWEKQIVFLGTKRIFDKESGQYVISIETVSTAEIIYAINLQFVTGIYWYGAHKQWH